tara:strand:- start:2 stop:160 length:159 start_codon:yes stop_codon:yes gene_type:complete
MVRLLHPVEEILALSQIPTIRGHNRADFVEPVGLGLSIGQLTTGECRLPPLL